MELCLSECRLGVSEARSYTRAWKGPSPGFTGVLYIQQALCVQFRLCGKHRRNQSRGQPWYLVIKVKDRGTQNQKGENHAHVRPE